jgi:hypothetical protein
VNVSTSVCTLCSCTYRAGGKDPGFHTKSEMTSWHVAGKVVFVITNNYVEISTWIWNTRSALQQRFSNCGPRTTSGPRVLPLWSS